MPRLNRDHHYEIFANRWGIDGYDVVCEETGQIMNEEPFETIAAGEAWLQDRLYELEEEKENAGGD